MAAMMGLSSVGDVVAPVLPKPDLGKPNGRSQLQRPGTLVARDIDRLLVSTFGRAVTGSPRQQVTLAAIQLRLAPPLIGSLDQRQAPRR